MQPLCVYHSADLDGKGSAAIVGKALSGDVEFYGYNYGEFDWSKITPDRDVYMVDVSLQPFSEMVKLQQACKRLIWIDHHHTAIKGMEEHNKAADNSYANAIKFKLQGAVAVPLAAIELTWRFFFPNVTMPLAVQLIGRWDVWDHENHPMAMPFQYGMRAGTWDPKEDFYQWMRLLGPHAGNKLADEITRKGIAVHAYQKRQDEIAYKSRAFETDFEGHVCVAMNTQCGANSTAFESREHKYPFGVSFGLKKSGKWLVSLYKLDGDGSINLGELAEKHGGGGHVNAAGFTCDELPQSLWQGLRPVGTRDEAMGANIITDEEVREEEAKARANSE